MLGEEKVRVKKRRHRGRERVAGGEREVKKVKAEKRYVRKRRSKKVELREKENEGKREKEGGGNARRKGREEETTAKRIDAG